MNKIIFTGPMGAGKTTAIGSISEVPPIRTDVKTTDSAMQRKELTTVAMDYGFFTLDDGSKVHLYGTPGQARFDYMWSILTEGGIGLVLLLDNANESPLDDLVFYLDAFKDFIEKTGVVIGITRMDVASDLSLMDYQEVLMERGQVFPLFEVDAREPDDVKILIHALLAILQY